jgi:hypothetical protein
VRSRAAYFIETSQGNGKTWMPVEKIKKTPHPHNTRLLAEDLLSSNRPFPEKVQIKPRTC